MRVLLVEDDDGIRTLAKMALERVGGCTVTAVDRGQKAVDLAPGLELDVMMIDMMMPGLDGMATLERMRALNIHTPVIFFTARTQPQDVARYLEAGAAGTVKKPFDPLLLADQVRAILRDG